MNDSPCSAHFNAAKDADWRQVVLNGGPPCFHLEDGCFCLRAERWEGHKTIHQFVSLESLLRSVAPGPRAIRGVCIVCGSALVLQFWRRNPDNLKVHCNDCGSEVTKLMHDKRQPHDINEN